MSRPAHIAPLDAALADALTNLPVAEKKLRDFLVKHIDLLDEYDRIKKERADAYYAIGQIEKAVCDLGYVVIVPYGGGGTVPKGRSLLDDKTLDINAEMNAARELVHGKKEE